MKGWMGRILRVDLSNRKLSQEPLDEALAHAYLGGRGLNARVLYSELKPGVDPLGPENKLVLGAGPCNGTLAPGSQRLAVSAKSPITGFIGDANTGGSLGATLKYAGYDMVIIEGQSESPVCLWIDDGRAELLDARDLWGKTVKETHRALQAKVGDPGISVISIGPAGENGVKFACIVGDFGRIAGRTGLGAVMGSKNLKAVAARGGQGVAVAHPELLQKAAMRVREQWLNHPQAYQTKTRHGTTGGWWRYDKFGMMSAKNFQTGVFEGSGKLVEALEQYYVKPKACFSCPVPCDRLYVVSTGPYAGTYGEGLQAGQLGHYLSQIGVRDLEFMLAITALTDDLGMNLMDMAGVISFAMQCYEEEILSEDDLGGTLLRWGTEEGVLKLIDMTVRREGIGDVLAEGLRGASQVIGKGSEELAMHVKGTAMTMRDPRCSKAYALAYAVSSRGADHTHALAEDTTSSFFVDETADAQQGGGGVDPYSEEGKPELVRALEDVRAVQSSLQQCILVDIELSDPRIGDLARFLNAATGMGATDVDILRIGERILNLERAFNVREGLTRADDTLPKRFLEQPMPEGPGKGQTVNLEVMLDGYYELRGWDLVTGFPTAEKLRALDLEEVAKELAALGKPSQSPSS